MKQLSILIALGAVGALSCAPQMPAARNSTSIISPTTERGDRLAPALRREVEALKRDIALAPTTMANYDTRMGVFWRWGNAASLAGIDINPAFSATVAAARRPGFATTATEAVRTRTLNAMDEMARELAWREANPTAIGTLRTSTPGPFVADSHATIEQVYEVGSEPIVPGGGVLFTPYIYIGGIEFQTDNPAEDNYLSVRASRPDASFELDSQLVGGIMSGAITGPPRPRPFFRLVEGRLARGDTVTVTIGDRTGGSRGYLVPNFQTSGLRMKVWIKHSASTPNIVLPEIQFPVIGLAEATGVRGFAPSIMASGECASVSVRTEDRYRNRTSGPVPGFILRVSGAELARLPKGGNAFQTVDRVCFSSPGVKRIAIASEDGSLAGEVNPILVEDAPSSRVYWGETHGHSGFAEGNGTVDGYLTYARDDARLDFAALSEHDLWMDDFEWEQLRTGSQRFTDPGKFVAYLAYEWTQQSPFGGHHNVVFRSSKDARRVPMQEAPTLAPLYTRLKTENRPRDVVVIPHAHEAGDYMTNDPEVERMVEIVSNHGTFEWLGKAYLGQGHRIGFLGGSDSHTEHPGLRVLRRDQPQSDYPGGMSALYASARTPDAIFDALRDRSGYATNGEKIILRTTVNGAVTREAPVAGTTRIQGTVIGTAPISSITLVKNGRDIETRDYTAASGAMPKSGTVQLRLYSGTDPKAPLTASRGTRNWTGSVAINGARLTAVSAPGHENIFTESLSRRPGDQGRVDLNLRTHGAAKDVFFTLEDIQPGATVRFEGESGLGYGRALQNVARFDETAQLAAASKAPFVHAVSPDWPEDTFDVRFVQPAMERDRIFVFDDVAAPKPGDYYFVRVVQVNGGLAWSSATWLTE